MYCQNCGASNDNDAVFCESCGTRLEREENLTAGSGNAAGQEAVVPDHSSNPFREMQHKERKPISKLTAALVIELAAVIAVGVVAFNMGKKTFGAEQTASNYFVNMANGDWKAAYEKLDVDETEFINAGMFASANKENNLGIVNTYQVNGTTTDADNPMVQQSELGAEVRIDYRIKGDTENSSYIVSLNKQPGKKYFFFDDWKIGTSDLICKDYSVYVPKGAIVAMDGLVLDDRYLAADEDEDDYYGDINWSKYVIPQIFYGSHRIAVSMEDKADIAENIRIEYGSTRYAVGNLQWKKEALEGLMQTAGEDMQKIYAAALEGKELTDIEDLFSTDAENLDYIRESYQNLLSGLNEGSSVVTRVRFSDINASSDANGESSVRVSFEYDVEYEYEDWWSDEWEKETYQGSDEWRFHFVKENGSWVLANLGCESLYY